MNQEEKASKEQAITTSKQQQRITTPLLQNFRHQVELITSQHHTARAWFKHV
jgi:hypothetical protein